jgi:hypothetical protein
MKIIADNGGWIPARVRDYLNLAVGGRIVGLRSFVGLLRYLAQSQQGSIRTVNLVCFCPDYVTLTFRRDYVFSQQTGETTAGGPPPNIGEFAR